MAVQLTSPVYSGFSGVVTTTAALALTYTGLILYNPISSGITLVPKVASFGSKVAQAAALSFGLMIGYNQTTGLTSTSGAITPATNVTPLNTRSTPGIAIGQLFTAATLPTAPVASLLFGVLDTGALTTNLSTINPLSLLDNIGFPYFVLQPGAYLAFYTSAASTASSLVLGFTWTEQTSN